MPLTCTNLSATYRPEQLAFATSHAHGVSAKSNETMTQLYIYKYCIPMPKGATTASLTSADRKTFLFAATTASAGADELKPFTPITTEVDYTELGTRQSQTDDHRLVPSAVQASHQNGTNESGSKANDQNVATKWCVTSSQSQTPYLQYSFAKPVIVNRWMVLNAASESGDYVTPDFKLQYLDENGTWIDADVVTGNQLNKVVRTIAPITTTRVRLQIQKGEQNGGTTRIYEFAVYGLTVEEQTDALPNVSSVEDTNAEPSLLYDLSGRKVAAPSSHGVYIINGRKVVR